METWQEFYSEQDEYEVLLPSAGVEDWLLTPIKVKTQGLQILVDKMGTGIKCRELGQSKWQTAAHLGFKVTYQRKNPAIAHARLRNNGLNKPNFDGTMFSGFEPECK